MSTMSKTITIRINEDIYNDLTKTAEDIRISRSEVIRLSLEDNFQKRASMKNTNLPADDRENMLKLMGQILTLLGEINNHNSRNSSNLNQITKAVNSGNSAISPIDVEDYETLVNIFNGGLKEFSEVLYNLWLTLV